MASLLLIEDDVSMLDALHEILSEAGYHVNGLESAEAALAALEDASKELPDIIVTDFRLAGMSGLDLLTKMRSHDPWKNIPVICMSASIPPQMEEFIARQTNVVFVRKPFEMDELYAAVSRVLSR